MLLEILEIGQRKFNFLKKNAMCPFAEMIKINFFIGKFSY